MIRTAVFLSKVEEIAAEEPSYQHGQDGSHGQCDCIGLIIGAIRRAGGQWRGMHGSNYAARNELSEKIRPIAGTGDLKPGMLVFKGYEPGQGGYSLPARYEPGGQYYNGDLRDYYHVGVVMSVFPLKIRHMTTPKPKMDKSIGKWSYFGWCKKITSDEVKPMGKVIISGGNTELPINLRAAGSSSSALVAQIPQGAEADLIEGGGYWNRISWCGHEGYVKAEFIHDPAETGTMISVSKDELEKIYDTIGDMLGLRG